MIDMRSLIALVEGSQPITYKGGVNKQYAFLKEVETTRALNLKKKNELVAWAKTLPPSLAKLIGTKKNIKLKDGSTAIIDVDLVTDYRGISLGATIDGVFAGHASFSPNNVPEPDGDGFDLYADDRGSWSVTSVHVNSQFQRKGLATAFYDMMARAGMKIIASGRGYGGSLKPDGASLWDSRAKWKNGRRVHQRFWKPTVKKA